MFLDSVADLLVNCLTLLVLHSPTLLLVDSGALPLRGGGALLLVLSPAGRSRCSSVVGPSRGGRLGPVVVSQLGEPTAQAQESERD